MADQDPPPIVPGGTGRLVYDKGARTIRRETPPRPPDGPVVTALGKKIGTYGCHHRSPSPPHGEHRCTLTKDIFYPAEGSGWVEEMHDGQHACKCGYQWGTP